MKVRVLVGTIVMLVCSVLALPVPLHAGMSKAAKKAVAVKPKKTVPIKKRKKIPASHLLAMSSRLPERRMQTVQPVDAVSSVESLVHELGFEELDDTTEKVGSAAFSLLGKRYRFGGNGVAGIDCSAFVRTVFNRVSIRLPRTAREQFAIGTEVPADELQKGDLLFFHTYRDDASHVGIYLGNERMIHASSGGKRVMISDTSSPYYRTRFLGARRITADSSADNVYIHERSPSLAPVLELIAETGMVARTSF